MGRLLSIETGYSCNSRCGFCGQVGYRQSSGVQVDLSTDEIKAKIGWGARSGYDRIGFSGGEVTIRPDAIALIAYAREQGFEHIGLTTNGRMLAYPAFSRALVAAGVTTVNVSIHGHTAALHDLMTHSPGSFEQAIAGLKNVAEAAARHRRRIELMSMSLAAPMNIDHFPDIVRLVGALGVRLHMLQPFIVNEETLDGADRYMVGYDRIERALRAGVEAARAHDGKVKLYNIPPCLLRDVAERVDAQDYALDVFSRHDRSAADEANVVPWGFYRIAGCATCADVWSCPGFRREHFPEEGLVASCLDALGPGPVGDAGELWLSGSELLSAAGLSRLCGEARARGAARVALVTGGSHRLGRALFDVAVDAGATDVVLVARFRDPRAADPAIRERGNVTRLRQAVERVQSGSRSRALRLTLTLGLQDLLAPDGVGELAALRALGVRRFVVGLSYALHDVDQATGRPRDSELREALSRLRAVMTEGGDFEFVDQPAPAGYEEPSSARQALLSLLPRRDGARLMPRLPINGVDYYFVVNSVPHWFGLPMPGGARGGDDGAALVSAGRLVRGAVTA